MVALSGLLIVLLMSLEGLYYVNKERVVVSTESPQDKEKTGQNAQHNMRIRRQLYSVVYIDNGAGLVQMVDSCLSAVIQFQMCNLGMASKVTVKLNLGSTINVRGVSNKAHNNNTIQLNISGMDKSLQCLYRDYFIYQHR